MYTTFFIVTPFFTTPRGTKRNANMVERSTRLYTTVYAALGLLGRLPSWRRLGHGRVSARLVGPSRRDDRIRPLCRLGTAARRPPLDRNFHTRSLSFSHSWQGCLTLTEKMAWFVALEFHQSGASIITRASACDYDRQKYISIPV